MAPTVARKPLKTRAARVQPEEQRRHVRRVDRREEIIDAAIPVFREHGPGVTLAEIARAAGTSEGTVFYVFHDRADLLRACIQRIVESSDLLASLDQATKDNDFGRRLHTACEALRANMVEVMPLVLALQSTSGGVSHQPEGIMTWDFGPIERLLSALLSLPAGSRRASTPRLRASADELAADLIGHLFAGVMRFIVAGKPLPSIKRTLDVFLHGALA
jgi:AcrR family transcriptional regulator